MISDASQLAALDLAIEVATGRRKLNASEAALFRRHIEEIRQRIIDAAARRETKTEGARG
jgi:hypothetical protein